MIFPLVKGLTNWVRRKFKALLWRLQPLTIKPAGLVSAASDLFVWRNGEKWRTYFHIVDYSFIVEPGSSDAGSKKSVLLIYFSSNGRELLRVEHKFSPSLGGFIDISADLADQPETYGTFCVIHSDLPRAFSRLGCNLSERGYVGYHYDNSEILSYIHGNFDAICMNSSGRTICLGGRSLLPRMYSLQYVFDDFDVNELVIANPSPVKILFRVSVICLGSIGGGQTIFNSVINSRGCELVKVLPANHGAGLRVEIVSSLCMSRPIVFARKGKSLNAFHG